MANKYDRAAVTADAQRLEALATSARSTMLTHTTEKATRLGADGERLGRQARAADSQRVEADRLAANLATDAAGYDARAAALDQRAAAAAARGDYAGSQEATELREEAAKAREGATVARGKAAAATEDAQRLAAEAAALRVEEQAIDAELADLGGRMPATELAVDHLEWHAEKARAMADAVGRADDLTTEAAAATARGDHAAAAALRTRAESLRDDADVLAFVRERPPFPDDLAALQAIGVSVTAADLSVPLPDLIDPSSPMNPLADASGVGGEPDAAALAHDMTGDPVTGDPVTGAESPDAGFDSGFDSGFDTPAYESGSFADPMLAEAVADGFASASFDTHDDGFADPTFDTDGDFGSFDAVG